MLASLCLLPGSAGAQVVTEFSAGISAFAQPLLITAGPLLDGNLWFTEFAGNRIGRITVLTPSSVVSRKTHGAAGTFDLPLSLPP